VVKTAAHQEAADFPGASSTKISCWQKYEKPLELSELLQQNFIQYDGTGPVPSQIQSYLSTNFKDLRELDKEDPRPQAKAKYRWYVPDPKNKLT